MPDDQIRPRPPFWAPELRVEANMVTAFPHLNGVRCGHIGLAFFVTDNEVANGKLVNALFESAWQVAELFRLGRYKELAGITDKQKHAPDAPN